MTHLSALRQGTAVAATVGVLYIACAIVALVDPTAIANAMQAVVHGLRSLDQDVPATTAPAATVGLLYVVAYSFVAGTLYGAIRNALGNFSQRR